MFELLRDSFLFLAIILSQTLSFSSHTSLGFRKFILNPFSALINSLPKGRILHQVPSLFEAFADKK